MPSRARCRWLLLFVSWGLFGSWTITLEVLWLKTSPVKGRLTGVYSQGLGEGLCKRLGLGLYGINQGMWLLAMRANAMNGKYPLAYRMILRPAHTALCSEYILSQTMITKWSLIPPGKQHWMPCCTLFKNSGRSSEGFCNAPLKGNSVGPSWDFCHAAITLASLDLCKDLLPLLDVLLWKTLLLSP